MNRGGGGFGGKWQGRSGWRRGFGGQRGPGGYRRGGFRGGRGSNYNANREASNDTRPSTSADSDIFDPNDLSQAEPMEVETNKSSGPYIGWKLYIQDQAYEAGSPISIKLKATEKYYKTRTQFSEITDKIETDLSFKLDYKDFITDEDVLEKWPDVANDIRETPEKTLDILGLAMHKVLTDLIKQKDPAETAIDYPKVIARIINYDHVVPLRKIKSNNHGKFVTVEGTVVKASNSRPLCLKMLFQCNRCKKEFTLSQPYGKYTPPTKCVVRGCRGQSFHPITNQPDLTETTEWQNIKLQEIVSSRKNGEVKNSGDIPISLDVELAFDLVDSCVPGDVVSVSGTVKVMIEDVKTSREKCTYRLYIVANSIVNKKATNENIVVSINSNLELSNMDLEAVREIVSEDNLFKLLVASLCPSIYGHEMVKAGLLLTLFGGTSGKFFSEQEVPVRGDPHILIVGDPGLGKSVMLRACSFVSPRGVYVCGNTTSVAGLTITLNKENGNDYTLEAGALPLADLGDCCIDEFDKMPHHSSLLETMEQQSISIAKAGMICSLPARTSIIAAANPVGGHYDKSKTVSENLRMGKALLSRFDLVFILMDKPNVAMDCKVSEYIVQMHDPGKKLNCIRAADLNVSFKDTASSSGNLSFGVINEEPLIKRLKYKEGEDCDLIPHQLIRMYIAYARKYVHPELTPGAANVLQKFYMELRERLNFSTCTPVTNRQLESLIRLTEARAKLDLREECTEQDAVDVIELVKHSMIDVWSDEFGTLHLERSEHGAGLSGRSKSSKFIAALTKLSETKNTSIFSVDEMKALINELGLQVPNVANFLDSLNNHGYIIKRGPKLYKLLSTDF